MKIADIRVTPLSLPVVKPYITAFDFDQGANQANHQLDQLLVEVESDDGLIGYGECAPDPQFSPGLDRDAATTIIEDVYRPLLLGRDPRHVGTIIPTLEQAEPDAPFAVAPIDLGLWDLAGKAQRRPVFDLLGGQVRSSVSLHCSIGIKRVEEVAADARRALEEGYREFKLKVGGPDFDAELASVRTIREIGGDQARIRVDANEGWSREEAIPRIRELDAHRLILVEQPVPRSDLAGMRDVRRMTGVPVMADESCFGPADVAEIARAGAADAVNIKLMKCGGLWNARKMAAVSEATGLTCFVGGMVQETEVAVAAGFHFALSHEIVRYPTGILNMMRAPLAAPPWEVRDARAYPKGDIIGLGADPQPDEVSTAARN
jgi:L-alanine-DL-glutamate epimerase-like enolase superfamily enzyme